MRTHAFPFKASLIAALLMGLWSQAHAATAPTQCETIDAIGGVKFSIQECTIGNGPDTYYNITNNSGSSISFLAVSTSETAMEPWVERQNWDGFYFTEAQWDSQDYAWLNNLGTFDNLFGNRDTGVFVYQVIGQSPADLIASGSTSIAEFGFMGRPSTNFVAALGGSIVAQSYSPTVAVPEPSTYALMGLGLLGLGAALGRKRKAL